MESRVRKLTTAQRAALSRIEGLVEYWQISAEEIDLAEWPTFAAEASTIKYTHPLTGETWDGRGEQPEWLRRALLKEGYRVSELVPAQRVAENA